MLNSGQYCHKGVIGCFCKVGWPIEYQCPDCRGDNDNRNSYCVCPPKEPWFTADGIGYLKIHKV